MDLDAEPELRGRGPLHHPPRRAAPGRNGPRYQVQAIVEAPFRIPCERSPPMPFLNTAEGYGGATKTLHWVVVALFAVQVAAGLVMTRLPDEAGAARDALYNWHKTLGLVALAVAVLRLWARRAGELPPWAPCLTPGERRIAHHAESALYLAMFAMPVSGFVYVMAAGYGVMFAGAVAVPNPLPRWEWLALAGKWIHVAAALLLAAALAAHLWVVLRHTLLHRHGLIRRMLPGG
jgi:cytochrome b561